MGQPRAVAPYFYAEMQNSTKYIDKKAFLLYNLVKEQTREEKTMNIIHEVMNTVLPYIIAVLEILGVFIVTWSVLKEFWEYIQNTFMKKQLDIQFNLAVGLATGLEFKMAAEILKTVIIQSLDELYVLGAVILLRALMSFLIRFELKDTHTKTNDRNTYVTAKNKHNPHTEDPESKEE